jgi:hypothetical protein
MEEYATITLSNVYYFVLHMNPTKPIAELTWLQRLAFKKAKSFLDSVAGHADDLTMDATSVRLSDAIFAQLDETHHEQLNTNSNNGSTTSTNTTLHSGIMKGSDVAFDTFAKIDADKVVNIIYDYEKSLATKFGNQCMIKATIPSLGGGISWSVNPIFPEVVSFPDTDAIQRFNKYFNSSMALSRVENGYYNWATVNRKVHFFWRNILVPSHEVIHRHHIVGVMDDINNYKYTSTLPLSHTNGPIPTRPMPINWPDMSADGLEVPNPTPDNETITPTQTVTYDLSDNMTLMYQGVELQNQSLTYTYEQVRDFRNSQVESCNKRKYSLSQVDRATAVLEPGEYTGQNRIPNRPQVGGVTDIQYPSEILSSAGNLNVFLNNVKSKCITSTGTEKKLHQCHAVFGILYVVELLSIIDKNVHVQRATGDEQRRTQQYAKNYGHFKRLAAGQTQSIEGSGAGLTETFTGLSLREFKIKIDAMLSGGASPWTMTYIKHFLALEYAADFFEGKDTVENYFNPSFWEHINDEWVMAISDWQEIGDAPPGDLRVASWITQDVTSGGARKKRHTKRNNRKNRKTRRRST